MEKPKQEAKRERIPFIARPTYVYISICMRVHVKLKHTGHCIGPIILFVGENKKQNGQRRDEDTVNTSEGDLPVWARTRNRMNKKQVGRAAANPGRLSPEAASTGRPAASSGQPGAATAAKPLTRCSAKQT
jgi:hypothetical protein